MWIILFMCLACTWRLCVCISVCVCVPSTCVCCGGHIVLLFTACKCVFVFKVSVMFTLANDWRITYVVARAVHIVSFFIVKLYFRVCAHHASLVLHFPTPNIYRRESLVLALSCAATATVTVLCPLWNILAFTSWIKCVYVTLWDRGAYLYRTVYWHFLMRLFHRMNTA